MGIPTPRFGLPRRSREDSFLVAKDLSDVADRLEVVLGTVVDMTLGRLKAVSDAIAGATNLVDPGQLVKRAPSGAFSVITATADDHAASWGQVRGTVDKVSRATSASSNNAGLLVQRDASGTFGVTEPTAVTHPPQWGQVKPTVDAVSAASSGSTGTANLLVKRDANGTFGVAKPTVNTHPTDFEQVRVGPIIQRAADGNFWSDGELRWQRVGWLVHFSFRGIARSNGFFPLGNIPDNYLPTLEARYAAAIPGQNGDFRMENNQGIVRMSALTGQSTQVTGMWVAARPRTDV